MIKLFRFLIFIFCVSNTSAQTIFEYDSVSPSRDSVNFQDYLQKIDFLKFDSINYLQNPIVFYSENPISTLSFNYNSLSVLQKNRFSPNSENYRVTIPKTYVYYGVVSAKQQDFFIQHIQNIKQFNLEIDYRKNKGEGFYSHQEYSNENLNALVNFTSRKQNYSIDLRYNYRKINQNENGGIKSDSLFENNLFNNTQTLSTNLSTANNTFTDHHFKLSQYFIPTKLKYKLYFNHNLSYNKYNRIYTDIPDTSFFDFILIDSTETNDNYFREFYTNEFKVIFNTIFKGEIGIISEYQTYAQNDIDTNNLSHTLQLILNKKINQFNLQLKSSYILSGFNDNNYEINGLLNYNLKDELFKNISASIYFKNQSPNIFYLKYSTNNYRWNNEFSNSNDFFSEIKMNSKYGSLAYNYSFLNNYLFLNENKNPEQTNKLIQLHQFSYSYKNSFKKINIHLYASYQQDDETYFRLPQFIGFFDFNINGKLKALELKFGVVSWYYSSFYSNGYDPALNQFYLQNDKKTGNYPYFDFYIRSSIKTVEMKFAIQHFNAGFMSNGYYSTLSYPAPPRRFTFGISWKFTD